VCAGRQCVLVVLMQTTGVVCGEKEKRSYRHPFLEMFYVSHRLIINVPDSDYDRVPTAHGTCSTGRQCSCYICS